MCEPVKTENKNLELAILTMQKNEDLLLEPWIQYYSKLMPYKNICILDNGSTNIDVINILKKYEEKGVNVNYSYNKKEDFEGKGNIIKDIAKEKYFNCDFIFFLDVDEFICLEGENCNKDDIIKYLKSLPNDKPYFYNNSYIMLNILNNENYYLNDSLKLKKIFLRGNIINDLTQLHIGFHYCRFSKDVVKYNTKIEIIHFHNKPYTKKLECTKEKMETRIDINDKEKLKLYKGNGYHLTNFLMQTEESYIQSQNDLISKKEVHYSTKFREKLREYGVIIPF